MTTTHAVEVGQSGEPDEWRHKLIEEHIERARGLTKRFWTGAKRLGLNEDDLEDRALFALWDAADEFDPALGVPFWPFARQHIKWDLLDLLRERKRALFGPPRRRAADAPTPPPRSSKPGRRDKIAAEALRAAMPVLSEQERMIVGYRHGGEGARRSWESVAILSGYAVSTVQAIHKRAIDKLRPEVKKRINIESM